MFLRQVKSYLRTSDDTDFVMVGVKMARRGPEAFVVANARLSPMVLAALAILRNAKAEVLEKSDLTARDRNFLKIATEALALFGADDDNVDDLTDGIGKTAGSA